MHCGMHPGPLGSWLALALALALTLALALALLLVLLGLELERSDGRRIAHVVAGAALSCRRC